VWTLGGSVGVEPRTGGGLVVWARFPESTMVPGGVFGLDALEEDGLEGDVVDLEAEEEEEALRS
jgi:hypothetical protein